MYFGGYDIFYSIDSLYNVAWQRCCLVPETGPYTEGMYMYVANWNMLNPEPCFLSPTVEG